MTTYTSPDAVRTARSLAALFQGTVQDHGDQLALRTSEGDTTYTWADWDARVRRIAAGLHTQGVRHGDTVALMLGNRPEFNLIDAAALHLGAVPFSIYNTSSAEQIRYLFSNAGNRVVVCEEQYVARLREATDGTASLEIVCVDGSPNGTLALDVLEQDADADFDFDAAWNRVQPGDVATLIYTSGTTGPPKGVELTHANIQSNLAALLEINGVGAEDSVVSYLPDAHIVNRFLAHYLPIATGASVTTIADPKSLVTVLPSVRPTIFVSVPMLWYKIKAALEKRLAEQSGLPGSLARWAVGVGGAKARVESTGHTPSLSLRVQAALADRLVLSKLRARVGLDRTRLAVTGAAPIAPEALEFIVGLGLPVCEAWGMSELSALATVNRPGAIRVGTVGQAAPGVEVRLADDGELLVRGPGVMKGYRNDPEKTAEAVDPDGWMHTGDIGTIDDEGYVRIVDRKKEIIINSGGKNMSPSNIENHVKIASPLVGSVVAIGDQRPFVVALVTLDPDAAATYAAENGLPSEPASLSRDSRVRELIAAGIEAANVQLSRVEQIKYFEILPSCWEPGGDELTPTMKLKRKPIAEKYAATIDGLYTAARKA